MFVNFSYHFLTLQEILNDIGITEIGRQNNFLDAVFLYSRLQQQTSARGYGSQLRVKMGQSKYASV